MIPRSECDFHSAIYLSQVSAGIVIGQRVQRVMCRAVDLQPQVRCMHIDTFVQPTRLCSCLNRCLGDE